MLQTRKEPKDKSEYIGRKMELTASLSWLEHCASYSHNKAPQIIKMLHLFFSDREKWGG